MKGFFARLNPTERRFVVGVIVVFFVVINLVWVWPHFSDWGETKTRMKTASDKLIQFEGGTNKIPVLEREIAKYQAGGEAVPAEDQAVRFVRTIQNQAAQSGVIPSSMSPQRATGTNAFFVEQSETLTLQCQEKQLVDFLYSLGAGSNSLIRVKVLSVQPDQSHQQLASRITLVASYQKKGPTPRTAAPVPAAAPAPVVKLPVATVKPGPTNPMIPSPATAPKSLTPIKK